MAGKVAGADDNTYLATIREKVSHEAAGSFSSLYMILPQKTEIVDAVDSGIEGNNYDTLLYKLIDLCFYLRVVQWENCDAGVSVGAHFCQKVDQLCGFQGGSAS